MASRVSEPGRMPRNTVDESKISNDLYEAFPVLAFVSVTVILLGFLGLLALHVYMWYRKNTTDIKYTKMESQDPYAVSSAPDEAELAYKAVAAGFQEPWQGEGGDAKLFSKDGHNMQYDVTAKGGSDSKKEKRASIANSGYQEPSCSGRKSSNTSAGEDINDQERGHSNMRQEASEESCQSSLPNSNKIYGIEGAEKELNQKLENFEMGNTLGMEKASGWQLAKGTSNSGLTDEEILAKYKEKNKNKRWSDPIWKVSMGGSNIEGSSSKLPSGNIGCNSGCNSGLTDEEILAKYKEKNKNKRWSDPSWKMNKGGSKGEGSNSWQTDSFKGHLEKTQDSAKVDKRLDFGNGDGVEKKTNTFTLTIGQNFEGTEKIRINNYQDKISLHSCENTDENFGIRIRRDGTEEMNKPNMGLLQQCSAYERKLSQTEKLNGDENLSGNVAVRREGNIEEVVMRRRRESVGGDSIIFFDYKYDSRKKFSNSDTLTEAMRPTAGVPSENTGQRGRRSIIGSADDEDIEYDLLSESYRFNGVENSGHQLAKKTDEVLKALMISTYGNSNSNSNNTKLLLRSYSDSELVKQRSLLMGNKLYCLYNFSTSNLRSRQMPKNQLNIDSSKTARKKKGKKGFSLKLQELKKLFGSKKKKRT